MLEKNWTKTKLCPFSLGLGIGVAEGLYLLVFAWAGRFFGYGTALIEQIGHTFHGYAPTVLGGFVGGFWGLVDGFIFGLIVALIYNLCMCWRCSKACEIDKENKINKL